MRRAARRVVCVLRDHRWVKARYEGADTDDGYYLHCLRCGKDDHTGPFPVGLGAVPLGLGPGN